MAIQLTILSNARLFYSETDKLFVFSQFIYPKPEVDEGTTDEEPNQRMVDGKYEHFTTMNNVVVEKVKEIIEEESSHGIYVVVFTVFSST